MAGAPQKMLSSSYAHKTSKQGKLFFPALWVKEKLKVGEDEDVLHYDIPGTDAVLLIKPDNINGLPDKIKNILKSDKEVAADVEAFKAQVIQDYLDDQESKELGEQ